ncbi:MADF domain-containing protein [Aphis craccivora]|uniref:MADF domain-containing protein n=1 Tax=Aphis craccivora TaxID=307492 RepID=A0A6G0VZ07_APHCR|nr:MADF domain-containing protein [Aphis craccivora]
MFAVNCPYAIRNIPHRIKSFSNLLPFLFGWYWHIRFSEHIPEYFSSLVHDIPNGAFTSSKKFNKSTRVMRFLYFLFSASECKERWKNLRSVFVRNLKAPPSGSGSKKKRPYYLIEAMQFALPFVKTNMPTAGNMPSVNNVILQSIKIMVTYKKHQAHLKTSQLKYHICLQHKYQNRLLG